MNEKPILMFFCQKQIIIQNSQSFFNHEPLGRRPQGLKSMVTNKQVASPLRRQLSRDNRHSKARPFEMILTIQNYIITLLFLYLIQRCARFLQPYVRCVRHRFRAALLSSGIPK